MEASTCATNQNKIVPVVGGPPPDTIQSLIMMCIGTFMGIYHRKQCRGCGGQGLLFSCKHVDNLDFACIQATTHSEQGYWKQC